tara:strand:+ start:298 stop:516 length:219 start_codon:yes stop_codon:yes gene_type:complete
MNKYETHNAAPIDVSSSRASLPEGIPSTKRRFQIFSTQGQEVKKCIGIKNKTQVWTKDSTKYKTTKQGIVNI